MDPFALVADGDAEGLQRALAADPGLAGSVNGDGVPLVRWALYRGRRDLADDILAAGPPLDVFDAAAVGDTERVAHLVSRDRTLVNARSSDGFTPLHLAAYLAGPPTVAALLALGADPAAVATNAMRVQPLHSAAAAGQVEVAALLVRAGAPVDAAQQGGYRALHEAARAGNRRLVELLVGAGADPTVQADDGSTPAMLAEAAGHSELAISLAQR